MFNIQPNFKVAVEFWEPKELPLYGVIQRLAPTWVGKAAEDYLVVGRAALECAGIHSAT